jgi:pimeloyl-ACP methyl ester carboxylesterase
MRYEQPFGLSLSKPSLSLRPEGKKWASTGSARTGLAMLLAFLAAPAFAQPAQVPTAPAPAAVDYADPANWLCLPGRQDACGRPLATADLTPSGYGPVTQSTLAADAPIDCFYVYPTISRDPGLNSDMSPGIEEQAVAAVQFARFASVCRTFAPVYRQGTLASIPAVVAGQNPAPIFNLAYGDVLAAWRHYLARHNNGRPFVLIGHSQGTIHLMRLLAGEIEGRPEAARMLSALLIGFNVEVPEGQATGGTFRTTPLCTRAGQTGCVVSYVSFRAGSPPPEGALFGRASAPGRTVACTNPAYLAQASAPLESYWYAGPSVTSSPSAITWSSAGPPPATFLRTEGLVSATCVHDGRAGYLAVAVNADPADARTDRIPGDVVLGGAPAPGWGLHLVDVGIAQGDLIRLIAAQRDSWLRARR